MMELHRRGPQHVTAASIADIKVGTTLWLYDSNRRVYTKHGPGGEGIERGHYVPDEVVGETRTSWVMASGAKLAKEDLEVRGQRFVYGRTWVLDIEDDLWLRQHRTGLFRVLQDCRDVSKLKAIADILGFVPKEKEQQP